MDEMAPSQWEQLCDGCGKCCLHKLQDEATGQLHYTRVACRLLDGECGRCRDYSHRRERVADCLLVTVDMARQGDSLPDTCAYRLLAEGCDLPHWHPLISGDPSSVAAAGHSVAGRVVSEEFVHPEGLDEHIIRWVSC